ncbi:MAG: 1-acyl-sn-glycerol-3-phosphate acyltransferase [Chitinivibrionales bacterium]|nr:1-acyl-sn-glycerol-3-phosphate acyltransferase [Chitinivibrionales bacterium]
MAQSERHLNNSSSVHTVSLKEWLNALFRIRGAYRTAAIKAVSSPGQPPPILFWHSISVYLWFVASIFWYGGILCILSLVHTTATFRLLRRWGRRLLKVGKIGLSIKGLELLDSSQQYVFIVNHASVFDVPVLYTALSHRIIFLAKKELFTIPFFATILRKCGCIALHRTEPKQAREALNEARVAMHRLHASIVLFPEGTRSTSGKIRPFKSGSFRLVFDAHCKVVPVLLVGTAAVLPKKGFFIRPGMVYCEFSTPIDCCEARFAGKEDFAGHIRDILISMKKKCEETFPDVHPE